MLAVLLMIVAFALLVESQLIDPSKIAGDVMTNGGCYNGATIEQQQGFADCVQRVNSGLYNAMQSQVVGGGKCSKYVPQTDNPTVGVCKVIGTKDQDALIQCMSPAIIQQVTSGGLFSNNIGKAMNVVEKCSPGSNVLGRKK